MHRHTDSVKTLLSRTRVNITVVYGIIYTLTQVTSLKAILVSDQASTLVLSITLTLGANESFIDIPK